MRNSENVLNILSEHSNVSGYKFERLYRILFNEQMFYAAYQRIYAKQGNMTSGTDGKTVDQMSVQRIESLIVSLRDESKEGVHSQEERKETTAWNTLFRG